MLIPFALLNSKEFPVVESATTYNSGASTSGTISFTTPTVNSGDLLLVILAPAFDTTLPITKPADFTELWALEDEPSGSLVSAVYYRVCDGTEDASYDWTLSASDKYPVGTMVRISGASTSNPVPVNSGPSDDWQTVGRQTTTTCASVTTTSEKNLIIRGALTYIGQRNLSWDSITEIDNVTSTGSTDAHAELIVGYDQKDAPGATGTASVTAATGSPTPYWTTFTIAIAPA